ncbi:MAG: hypothetical protein IT529_01190 [Burkholderiales bacterium]|nr:hypothetical protein [Burkholderiales bacterium]
MTNWMRDPTAETAAVKRQRRAPPPSLEGKRIGLFDIGKTRTGEFLDQVERRLHERGLATVRCGKPTNAKVATPENLRKVASEVDVVLIGLSD